MIEERIGFTKVINDVLKDDESLAGRLPINPENDDIFSSMEDGIILCKLINSI